jgi:hypothetical protein
VFAKQSLGFSGLVATMGMKDGTKDLSAWKDLKLTLMLFVYKYVAGSRRGGIRGLISIDARDLAVPTYTVIYGNNCTDDIEYPDYLSIMPDLRG